MTTAAHPEAVCENCAQLIFHCRYRDAPGSRYEPDYVPGDDPVIWRHHNGYAACNALFGRTVATPASTPDERLAQRPYEEVGEVAREINDYRHGLIDDDERWPRMRKELVQVAAMACAWIAAIDSRPAKQ